MEPELEWERRFGGVRPELADPLWQRFLVMVADWCFSAGFSLHKLIDRINGD